MGANDGGATTGLLMAIADQIARAKSSTATRCGWSSSMAKKPSRSWSASDSTYGSRHLAAKWGRDGTLSRIKAFMLADMIGDKDLDIQRETSSTEWLVDLVRQAAKKFGYEHYFFQSDEAGRRRSSGLRASAACRRST